MLFGQAEARRAQRVRDDHASPGPHTLGGLHQAPVDAVRHTLQHEQLDSAAVIDAAAQASLAHPRVVRDQEVPGAHEPGKFREPAIEQGAVGRDMQQPRRIAVRRRFLRDAVVWQRVNEVLGAHTRDVARRRNAHRRPLTLLTGARSPDPAAGTAPPLTRPAHRLSGRHGCVPPFRAVRGQCVDKGTLACQGAGETCVADADCCNSSVVKCQHGTCTPQTVK